MLIFNDELQKIYDWTVANKLSLNTEKTVAMIFSNRRIQTLPPLLIKNQFSYDVIQRVDNFKMLGIFYDEQLKFKHHVTHLTNKLSVLAGMFHKLKFILPSYILKKMYNAQVTSMLNYNVPIWCCNYSANINPILTLQKRIIRNITKSEFLAHSKPLFKKCNVLNIFDINKLYLATKYFKNPAKYAAPLEINHEHNTRNQHLLRPARCTTTLMMNSFLSQGPTIYNEIPDEIKQSGSVHLFKKNLKKHFFSTY